MKFRLLTLTSLATFSLVAMSAASAFNGHPPGNRLDKDGDGAISEAELDAHKEKLLAQADSNNDGKITREERREYRKKKRAERRARNNPDTNGDGVISKEEHTARAEKRFERLDKNGDGVISKEEMRRGKGKGKRAHKRGKRRHKGKDNKGDQE